MTRRTPEQLAAATREAEAWLDELDPAVTPAEDAAALRAVGAAQRAVLESHEELARAVLAAREAGQSWGLIGSAIGISRQAARERFGKLVEA